MTTRDRLRATIISLRELIAYANGTGNQVDATRLKNELAVAKDSLQLLDEEQADVDVHSSDPIVQYCHDKKRSYR